MTKSPKPKLQNIKLLFFSQEQTSGQEIRKTWTNRQSNYCN